MKRFGSCAGLAALFFGFGAFAAAPAHAATTVRTVETDCKYYVDKGEGITADLPPADSTITAEIPAQVETGQSYDVKISVKTQPAFLPLDIFVDGITINFLVNGGATPTKFQGKIAHAESISNAPFDFGTFTGHLTAPATPGTVTIKIGDVTIDKVTLGASEIPDVFCVPPDGVDLTLGTTGVVPEAPPGAPNAVADSAKTKAGEPVTVDVLANDTASNVGPIDESSLAIAAQGTKGHAEIVDGKLVYTPNAGATGVDNLQYQICTDQSQVQQPGLHRAAVEPLCAVAAVTITIGSSNVGGQGSTPSTASATTTTAAKELPRTGRSTTPTAAIGFGTVGLGAAVLFFTRRKRAVTD